MEIILLLLLLFIKCVLTYFELESEDERDRAQSDALESWKKTSEVWRRIN